MTNNTYSLIGSNGSTIAFDDATYSVMRDTVEGLSGYPVEYDSTAPPGYLGEVVNSTAVIPRTITLSVRVWGEGRAQLEERRNDLIAALNPLLGQAQFRWHREDGNTYIIDVVPDEESPEFSEGTAHNARYWDCEIALIAHNPTWRLSTQKVVKILSANGFKLPFKFPITVGNQKTKFNLMNNGTAPTPVIIDVKGRLDAPISFINQTTGETITIRKTIMEGESLHIDTRDDNLKVTFKNTQGEESDALHLCSVGSQFWKLKPGLNVMTYDVTQRYDSCSGTVTYTERWVSL